MFFEDFFEPGTLGRYRDGESSPAGRATRLRTPPSSPENMQRRRRTETSDQDGIPLLLDAVLRQSRYDDGSCLDTIEVHRSHHRGSCNLRSVYGDGAEPRILCACLEADSSCRERDLHGVGVNGRAEYW